MIVELLIPDGLHHLGDIRALDDPQLYPEVDVNLPAGDAQVVPRWLCRLAPLPR